MNAQLNLARPDILEVVGRYTSLRKIGREYRGHSPCHDDRNPSLRINAVKGVWYCDPCGHGGDVIAFVQVVEKVSFKEALSILDITDTAKSRPPRSNRILVEAAKLAHWTNEMTRKAESLLREVGQKIRLAQELRDLEFVNSLEQEWAMLETIAEDLQHKDRVLEMYRQREAIEKIFAEGIIEPWPEFPELTPAYRSYLDTLPKPPLDEVRKRG